VNRLRAALFAASLQLFSPLLRAEAVAEHELRAGYLYNFVLHTEWPAWSRANLNICILDDAALGEAMSLYEHHRVQGMRLVIARLSSLLPIRQCQLLYVPASRQASLRRIAADLAGLPVLTVSDSVDDGESALSLRLEGQRLVYEVNLPAFQRAGLKPRETLLGLAHKVRK
jgi:hypothetical protein